jgi:hypothetical protein
MAVQLDDVGEIGHLHRGFAQTDGLIGEHDYGKLIALGQIEGPDRLVEAVLHGGRGHNDPRALSGHTVNGQV